MHIERPSETHARIVPLSLGGGTLSGISKTILDMLPLQFDVVDVGIHGFVIRGERGATSDAGESHSSEYPQKPIWHRLTPLGDSRSRRGSTPSCFDFTIDGPGIAKGGSGVLRVDGEDVAKQKIPKTIPFLILGDETFDIGVDTRQPDGSCDFPKRTSSVLADPINC
jgi:hypothetical protein